MSQPRSRSLSLALRRLRFAVVVACLVIGFSQGIQVVVWSLSTFTDLRYTEAPPEGETPLIIQPKRRRGGFQNIQDPRWKKDKDESKEPLMTMSIHDRMFEIAVTVTRTMGLLACTVILPLLALGIVLAVQIGAAKVERAITALLVAIVMSALAMPLGGWFTLGWHQGTISDYERMVESVEAARDEGFSPGFYAQFLLLPSLVLAGYIFVGFRFSAGLEGVGFEIFDPALEREAANVEASSLHGTGRTSGALKRALKDKPAKRPKTSTKMTQVSGGEMPRRLI